MWLTPEIIDHLIYWKNPVETGVVFGSILVFLVAVKYISLISVVGNLCLALLSSTVAFRIYKSVLAFVNKTQDGHPFQKYLDANVQLPKDKVLGLVDCGVAHFNKLAMTFKSMILVENLTESLKFAFAMYALTFVGRLFNGLTILTIIWVAIFAGPRIYKDNQAKIDEALAPIKIKVDELMTKVKGSVPSVKKEE